MCIHKWSKWSAAFDRGYDGLSDESSQASYCERCNAYRMRKVNGSRWFTAQSINTAVGGEQQ